MPSLFIRRFARLFGEFLQPTPPGQAQARERARVLTRSTAALAAKDRTRFAFLPSWEAVPLRYFPDDLATELAPLAAAGLDFVPVGEGLAKVDVVIFTAHGSDLSATAAELRSHMKPGALLVAWLFDNHLPLEDNLKTARAVDFAFPSHQFASAGLSNPESVLGAHVPACSCQWTRVEAARLFQGSVSGTRSSQLLVNYVDYAFSWRSELLRALKSGCVEADVLLMDTQDRSRYFGKSRAERMQEWLRYKTTLILPVNNDLSTRFFDALLAGLVPLVPGRVLDFDAVVPPEDQQRLGIVRLDKLDMAAIRQAAAEAVHVYDSRGEAGARARHEYALNHHMLANRVGDMLRYLRDIGGGATTIEFYSAGRFPGLRTRAVRSVSPG